MGALSDLKEITVWIKELSAENDTLRSCNADLRKSIRECKRKSLENGSVPEVAGDVLEAQAKIKNIADSVLGSLDPDAYVNAIRDISDILGYNPPTGAGS